MLRKNCLEIIQEKIQSFDDGGENMILTKMEHKALGLESRKLLFLFTPGPASCPFLLPPPSLQSALLPEELGDAVSGLQVTAGWRAWGGQEWDWLFSLSDHSHLQPVYQPGQRRNGTLSREDFQRIPELAINPLGDRIINAFFPEGWVPIVVGPTFWGYSGWMILIGSSHTMILNILGIPNLIMSRISSSTLLPV